MRPNPYLSIVIPARNDDYQGKSFERMQIALSSFILQGKKYRLESELIIVDWNPPQENPLLKDALSLPDELGPVSIRFIIVPPSIHKKYGSSDKIRLIWAAAQNVGIRRAKGEFILPTNSDILFPDELIHFLSLEKLEKKIFYRANRHDIHQDALKCASLEERLRFCKRNAICIHKRPTESRHKLPEHPVLHTNGCDFVLLAKEHWHLLHGWPELNNLGVACDGLLCYMAYLAGLKEKILPDPPMCVYHIDHQSRWKTLYKQSAVPLYFRKRFYDQIGGPLLKMSKSAKKDLNMLYLLWEYEKVMVDMLTKKRSYTYNDEAWGLSEERFEEFIFS